MAYLAIFESESIEAPVAVINFTVTIFLVFFFKMFHHQARPFWVYDDIKTGTCYTQFGDPSGHSINAAYFANYIYFAYIRD